MFITVITLFLYLTICKKTKKKFKKIYLNKKNENNDISRGTVYFEY